MSELSHPHGTIGRVVHPHLWCVRPPRHPGPSTRPVAAGNRSSFRTALGGIVKILLFADLHLDTPFQWAGPDLARARRQQLRDTLTSILELAATHDVDAVACGGDLYEHDRFSPDTTNFLTDAFSRIDVPVLLAPGNHDWYGPSSLYALAHWPGNVHLFTETHLSAHTLADGVTVWGGAHHGPANTDGFLATGFRPDRGGVNLGLFHGSEAALLPHQESGKLPHAPFTADQVAASGLDHVMLGHFHTPRDSDQHTYPGNPDPLSFGESPGRGPVIFTIGEHGGVARERFSVATTAVTDVSVDLDGVTSSTGIRERAEAAVAGLSGIVRATLHGEVAPEVSVHLGDLRGVGAHLEAFMPRLGRVDVGYDFDRLAAEQTVRGQFVRDVRAAPQLDDDSRRKVLVTGLRALDGRTDSLEVC